MAVEDEEEEKRLAEMERLKNEKIRKDELQKKQESSEQEQMAKEDEFARKVDVALKEFLNSQVIQMSEQPTLPSDEEPSLPTIPEVNLDPPTTISKQATPPLTVHPASVPKDKESTKGKRTSRKWRSTKQSVKTVDREEIRPDLPQIRVESDFDQAEAHVDVVEKTPESSPSKPITILPPPSLHTIQPIATQTEDSLLIAPVIHAKTEELAQQPVSSLGEEDDIVVEQQTQPLTDPDGQEIQIPFIKRTDSQTAEPPQFDASLSSLHIVKRSRRSNIRKVSLDQTADHDAGLSLDPTSFESQQTLIEPSPQDGLLSSSSPLLPSTSITPTPTPLPTPPNAASGLTTSKGRGNKAKRIADLHSKLIESRGRSREQFEPTMPQPLETEAASPPPTNEQEETEKQLDEVSVPLNIEPNPPNLEKEDDVTVAGRITLNVGKPVKRSTKSQKKEGDDHQPLQRDGSKSAISSVVLKKKVPQEVVFSPFGSVRPNHPQQQSAQSPFVDLSTLRSSAHANRHPREIIVSVGVESRQHKRERVLNELKRRQEEADDWTVFEWLKEMMMDEQTDEEQIAEREAQFQRKLRARKTAVPNKLDSDSDNELSTPEPQLMEQDGIVIHSIYPHFSSASIVIAGEEEESKDLFEYSNDLDFKSPIDPIDIAAELDPSEESEEAEEIERLNSESGEEPEQIADLTSDREASPSTLDEIKPENRSSKLKKQLTIGTKSLANLLKRVTTKKSESKEAVLTQSDEALNEFFQERQQRPNWRSQRINKLDKRQVLMRNALISGLQKQNRVFLGRMMEMAMSFNPIEPVIVKTANFEQKDVVALPLWLEWTRSPLPPDFRDLLMIWNRTNKTGSTLLPFNSNEGTDSSLEALLFPFPPDVFNSDCGAPTVNELFSLATNVFPSLQSRAISTFSVQTSSDLNIDLLMFLEEHCSKNSIQSYLDKPASDLPDEPAQLSPQSQSDEPAINIPIQLAKPEERNTSSASQHPNMQILQIASQLGQRASGLLHTTILAPLRSVMMDNIIDLVDVTKLSSFSLSSMSKQGVGRAELALGLIILLMRWLWDEWCVSIGRDLKNDGKKIFTLQPHRSPSEQCNIADMWEWTKMAELNTLCFELNLYHPCFSQVVWDHHAKPSQITQLTQPTQTLPTWTDTVAKTFLKCTYPHVNVEVIGATCATQHFPQTLSLLFDLVQPTILTLPSLLPISRSPNPLFVNHLSLKVAAPQPLFSSSPRTATPFLRHTLQHDFIESARLSFSFFHHHPAKHPGFLAVGPFVPPSSSPLGEISALSLMASIRTLSTICIEKEDIDQTLVTNYLNVLATLLPVVTPTMVLDSFSGSQCHFFSSLLYSSPSFLPSFLFTNSPSSCSCTKCSQICSLSFSYFVNLTQQHETLKASPLINWWIIILGLSLSPLPQPHLNQPMNTSNPQISTFGDFQFVHHESRTFLPNGGPTTSALLPPTAVTDSLNATIRHCLASFTSSGVPIGEHSLIIDPILTKQGGLTQLSHVSAETLFFQSLVGLSNPSLSIADPFFTHAIISLLSVFGHWQAFCSSLVSSSQIGAALICSILMKDYALSDLILSLGHLHPFDWQSVFRYLFGTQTPSLPPTLPFKLTEQERMLVLTWSYDHLGGRNTLDVLMNSNCVVEWSDFHFLLFKMRGEPAQNAINATILSQVDHFCWNSATDLREPALLSILSSELTSGKNQMKLQSARERQAQVEQETQKMKHQKPGKTALGALPPQLQEGKQWNALPKKKQPRLLTESPFTQNTPGFEDSITTGRVKLNSMLTLSTNSGSKSDSDAQTVQKPSILERSILQTHLKTILKPPP
ncbi:hypothetical protein BLNAU_16535 [Blattamonas nauphoetae]|uniref:Uncharacterized protein n=1 Tax=Blattamonas nauphoetae TaxID=2049346 RepID=A0ABQ9XCG5_9EUKA|nr:hypothetical protein BLNAU_16535 [Blattamonas nauphoetae]